METDSQLAQAFHARFHEERTAIDSELQMLKGANPNSDSLDALRVRVATLRKALSDVTAEGFIPSYDQRQYELAVKSLEDASEQVRTSTAPKAKFAFKRGATKPSTTKAYASISQSSSQISSGTTPENAALTSTPADTLPPALAFVNRSQERLTTGELPSGADILLAGLSECVADLRGPDTVTAVQIRDVTNSIIVLPAVHGAVMIHGATRCTIVVSCRQFRMHTSQDVDIFLAVASNPSIEHCADIRFAALPPAEPSQSGLPSMSLESWLGSRGISEEDSTVAQKHQLPFVPQDFSHLRQTASPHWSMLTCASLAVKAPKLIAVLQGRAEANSLIDDEKVEG